MTLGQAGKSYDAARGCRMAILVYGQRCCHCLSHGSSRYALSPTIDGDSSDSPGSACARLLDEVRRRLRLKHYSLRTEAIYVGWIRRFILANGKRHSRDMGALEVEGFLSALAVRGKVAASTQNQALSALLFLYREVLGIELPWMETMVRAKRSQHVP